MPTVKRPFESDINSKAPDILIKELSNEVNQPTVAITKNIGIDADPSKRKKWSEDYKLSTFYIEKTLNKELTRKAKILGKGGKTLIVNAALREYLKIETAPKADAEQ